VPTMPLRAVDLNGDGLTDVLVQVRVNYTPEYTTFQRQWVDG